MEIPLQITLHGMPRSDALDARIREKVTALERFSPRITSCRVVVQSLGKHQHQGRQFQVEVDVRVPGHAEMIASRHHHEDVYVALRDAFDAMTRQVEDAAREQRGDVKTHEIPRHGTVARISYEEGIGFIEADDGREFYFSRENVVYPAFDRLKGGMAVQFVEAVAGEGLQAKRVSAGKHQQVA